MLNVNRAKYAQNPDLISDLLDTGTAIITGGPSTGWTFQGRHHGWADWNGKVQMLIREEHRDASFRDDRFFAKLTHEFAAYSSTLGRPDDDAEAARSSQQPKFDGIIGKIIDEMIAQHGLQFPYTCVCSVVNTNNPACCSVCETQNPTYRSELAAKVIESHQVVEKELKDS